MEEYNEDMKKSTDKKSSKDLTNRDLAKILTALASKSDLKKITTSVESLAEATARGFAETATKTEARELSNHMESVELRLSRIEMNHARRIDNIEDRLRILANSFEKQLKIKLPK